jgi:hypothetical protein
MMTDTMPVDTTWRIWAAELEGVYYGTCYHSNFPPHRPPEFDTSYNVEHVIGKFDFSMDGGYSYYRLEEGQITFIVPADWFERDTVWMSANFGSQRYQYIKQFIRSDGSLFITSGVYPGYGFKKTDCYFVKQ